MNTTVYSRTIPIKHDVDVFVAGGGPAGMAAAVTAARQGAAVFLAEGGTCFGGMGTAAGLPLFCAVTDGVNETSSGFGTDVYRRSLTQALLRGRKLVLEYERFYKQYLSGFEDMQLLGTGSLLGVRETRRIMGDYVLNVDDFKRRAVFTDEIGRFSYPVDLHAIRPDQESFEQFEREFVELRYKPGANYGVPYRCLTPLRLNNVLVAGRCVSSDRHIQGSLRVMPGCFITGQAAGMAAAMAADRKLATRQIQVPVLQARLAKIGAYLPNRAIEDPCA